MTTDSLFLDAYHSLAITNKMGPVSRKPVFGVRNQVRLKPACSATETS